MPDSSGNIKNIDRFFNKPTLEEAIQNLDMLWPTLTRAEKTGVREHAKKRNNPIWVNDDRGGRVGVKVMILASQLIYRFLGTEPIKLSTMRDISTEPYFQIDDIRRGGINEEMPTFKKEIASFAKVRQRDFPRYNQARDRFAFVYFACKAKKAIDDRKKQRHDEQATLQEALDLYEEIISNRCQTAAQVFGLIQSKWLQGLTYEAPHIEELIPVPSKIETTATPAINFIPDKLSDYLEPDGRFKGNRNGDDLHRIAGFVVNKLTYSEYRLVVISGKANAGKSGCIVEILRSLNKDGAPNIALQLLERLSENQNLLPVFTISVQDYAVSDLLLRILAFLSQLAHFSESKEVLSFEKKFRELQTEFGQQLDGENLLAVKRHIRDLHRRHPAFFILTNWEDLTWSTPRAQLRDQSKSTLVTLLYNSNAASRFVVTTTSEPTERSKGALPKHLVYSIPNPKLPDITRYLPELDYPECYAQALDDADWRMENVKVPGEHLILIAVALELCRGSPEWECRAIRELEKLSPDEDPLTSIDRPYPFIRLFLERLNDRNLLRIFMAIMASEDGLRPTSLIRALKEWDKDTKKSLNLADDKIVPELEKVQALANSFFLRNRMIKPVTNNQFSPLDGQLADENSWEIYETLRQTIMTVLADPKQKSWASSFNQTLRHATRHVAKLAFVRAQEWRARTNFANLTPKWQDLLLDIQTYEALLASINPDSLADSSNNMSQVDQMPLLHQASEAVFTCGERHAPAVAVRFAVKVLLLGTLDHDNRMSMCYDQDTMRMRLYMLPFLGVGQRHFDRLDDKSLEELPNELPEWMNSVFSTEEILRLLEGIAISALHAQTPQIVRWAWIRTIELIEGNAKNADDKRYLLARTVRVYCSTLDMAIQLGKPLEEASDANLREYGHARTLSQVKTFLATEFKDASKLTATAAPSVPFNIENIDDIQAVLRIRVRCAQLTGLLGNLGEAAKEFADIHSWDMALACLNRSGRAEVLEGRPARIALQMLMRSELLSCHGSEQQDEVVNSVRGMLSANAARLSRFGGAEQASVLVDRSRYEFVRKRFGLAYRYASEAQRFCEDNRVSYGMQINILLNLVSIQIECSVNSHETGINPLKNIREMEAAERDVDAVYQTACALKFKPTEAIALYLKVRLQQIRDILHPNKDSWREKFDDPYVKICEAIAIMDECGDFSYRAAMNELRDTFLCELPGSESLVNR